MITLLVIVILVLLIIAHELGHFIVAKIFGVRVEEFGVGYPPRALTFGKLGDTEYTLNWIPFGGFVRLFGDVGEGQHGKGSLVDANRAKQAGILVAGVVVNMIVAWMLFASALYFGVPQVVETSAMNENARLIVANVVPGSPADVAGIKPGDEVMRVVDGGEVAGLEPRAVVDFVKVRGGNPISITYMHAGIENTAIITPANAILPNAAEQPALGIALALVANKSLPLGEASVQAFRQSGNAFVIIVGDLWKLVLGALRGAPDISQIVGPVGIVSYVGEASQNGLGPILLLAAMISVNLAVINLIPIPALDGGRLAILAIESVIRRSAPRIITQLLNTIGIALIVILMVVVTYNDIARLWA